MKKILVVTTLVAAVGSLSYKLKNLRQNKTVAATTFPGALN